MTVVADTPRWLGRFSAQRTSPISRHFVIFSSGELRLLWSFVCVA